MFTASSFPSLRGQYGAPCNAFQGVCHRYPYLSRFRSTPKRATGRLPCRRIAKITTTVMKTVRRGKTRSRSSNVASKFIGGWPDDSVFRPQTQEDFCPPNMGAADIERLSNSRNRRPSLATSSVESLPPLARRVPFDGGHIVGVQTPKDLRAGLRRRHR